MNRMVLLLRYEGWIMTTEHYKSSDGDAVCGGPSKNTFDMNPDCPWKREGGMSRHIAHCKVFGSNYVVF